MTAPYAGELRKGAEPNTIEGWIEDAFKWRIHLHGTRQADGSYALTATVGDPGFLRVPAIDGEAK